MSIIRCDLPPEKYLVWRYPDKSPVFGSQLIVSQTQEAIILASGELISVLPSGAHTLKTANLPVLKDYIQDGKDSFPFDIWFVNKVSSTNFKWGTKTPVQIKDKNYGLLVPIGSYGSYECIINDFQSFFLQIVGNRYEYSIDELKNYLLPLVERETKNAIAEAASSKDVYNISTELNKISDRIKNNLKGKFNDYGLRLRDFYVQNISILSTDPSFEKLKQAIAESATIRLKAKAIQDSESGYKTERTLDVLEKLAGNEGGSASAFAGAGLGLGAGLNFGNKFMEISDQFPKDDNSKSPFDRLKALKELLDLGAISQQEYESKRKSIIDEL